MNERIKELMIQADYPAPELALRAHRLAELIVQECMRLCEHESNDDQYDEYDMGMEAKAGAIRETLKEHFGVEE